MTTLFHLVISEPLYNGLIFLMGLLPFFDAGVIIIIFTIIVKFILLPLSIKASKAQIQMRGVEGDLKNIKEKYKDNKEEQAKKTVEYYKEKGINPFVSIFILIIQLPIIIGLYGVFLKSGLPQIDMNILYSFITPPETINMVFLGLMNIAEKSIILAIIAGITTYFQISLSGGPKAKPGGNSQNDVARIMQAQMKYFFPVLVVFISYRISAALALYWITSNVFAIIQEIYIKKKYHKEVTVV